MKFHMVVFLSLALVTVVAPKSPVLVWGEMGSEVKAFLKREEDFISAAAKNAGVERKRVVAYTWHRKKPGTYYVLYKGERIGTNVVVLFCIAITVTAKHKDLNNNFKLIKILETWDELTNLKDKNTDWNWKGATEKYYIDNKKELKKLARSWLSTSLGEKEKLYTVDFGVIKITDKINSFAVIYYTANMKTEDPLRRAYYLVTFKASAESKSKWIEVLDIQGPYGPLASLMTEMTEEANGGGVLDKTKVSKNNQFPKLNGRDSSVKLFLQDYKYVANQSPRCNIYKHLGMEEQDYLLHVLFFECDFLELNPLFSLVTFWEGDLPTVKENMLSGDFFELEDEIMKFYPLLNFHLHLLKDYAAFRPAKENEFQDAILSEGNLLCESILFERNLPMLFSEMNLVAVNERSSDEGFFIKYKLERAHSTNENKPTQQFTPKYVCIFLPFNGKMTIYKRLSEKADFFC